MAASAQARAVVERLALGSSRVSRPLHISLGAVLGAACTVNRDSDQCVCAQRPSAFGIVVAANTRLLDALSIAHPNG